MIRAPIDFKSAEAESYRTLRTNIGSLRLPDHNRVLLVTSPRQGEGKSTTAANFAAACAYQEVPTLLIDGDLRRPSLSEVFGVDTRIGLSDLLRERTLPEAGDVAFETGVPYLDLVPAGSVVSNPAELLGRAAMSDLIGSARERYEWVIIDSPPVLPVTDAAVLARLVDGVVLVVDFRRTRMRMARKARDVLRSVRAPLLGVVVNQAKSLDVPGGAGNYYTTRAIAE